MKQTNLEARLEALAGLADDALAHVDIRATWTDDPEADVRTDEAAIEAKLSELVLEASLLWSQIRHGDVGLPARTYESASFEPIAPGVEEARFSDGSTVTKTTSEFGVDDDVEDEGGG